jgi:hypothetical protein
MNTDAPAAATVDSATTSQPQVDTPATPAFDAADQHTWSAPQREHWNKTGEQPTKQDSAPAAKKDPAVADSAPREKKNPADSASDSATDKSQQPHLKTKEDTEKRFKEILDENKALQRRLESLERGKATTETRDGKQESQPAPEVYKPLDEKEFFKGNPKPGEAGHKTYEDFVRAAGRHEGEWAARQAIAQENQRRETAEAKKTLSTQIEEAKKRYPDFQQRIDPAITAIAQDPQIPHAVKETMNSSSVVADLMYVLAEPAALADLIQTAKTNPAAAIRKIVLTEQLVIAELAKANGGDKPGAGDKGGDKSGDGKTRDASGKFVSTDKKDEAAEPKPRAPKPPTEVGGRGTTQEDELVAASRANDFKGFETEMWRRKRANAS